MAIRKEIKRYRAAKSANNKAGLHKRTGVSRDRNIQITRLGVDRDSRRLLRKKATEQGLSKLSMGRSDEQKLYLYSYRMQNCHFISDPNRQCRATKCRRLLTHLTTRTSVLVSAACSMVFHRWVFKFSIHAPISPHPSNLETYEVKDPIKPNRFHLRKFTYLPRFIS